MQKKEIRKRWYSGIYSEILTNVLESLVLGRGLESIYGIPEVNGLADLRGLCFPCPTKKKTLANKKIHIEVGENRFVCSNTYFHDIDFSFSIFEETIWCDCTFNKVKFNEINGRNIIFEGCSFDDCEFENSDLSNSVLNRNSSKSAGNFRFCKFLNSDLSTSIFEKPLIEGCVFQNCSLVETNFGGSHLRKTKFIGVLESTFFRGIPFSEARRARKNFNRLLKSEEINKMVDVDFTQSELRGVIFADRIDLSTCKFPISEEYVLVNRLSNTYGKMNEIIKNTWEEPFKTQGINLINNVYYNTEHQDQEKDFVDRSSLVNIGGKIGEMFFELLKKCNNNT